MDREGLVSICAGAAAGAVSTVVTNPLDTLRSRMASSREATGVPDKRIVTHIRAMYAEGVLRGASIGLGANMLASMPSNAVYLGMYHNARRQLENLEMNEHLSPIISAWTAVTATNLILAPTFLIRSRCQVDASMTIRRCIEEVIRHDGYRGFYRGTLSNIVGRCIEEGIFWYTYETSKRLTSSGNFNEKHSFLWNSLTVVGLSGVCKTVGSIAAYPYNPVINHMRTLNKHTRQAQFTRIMPTVEYIYRKDGLRGFYSGLSAQLARSIVSKTSQIYVFSLLMASYEKFQAKNKQLLSVAA